MKRFCIILTFVFLLSMLTGCNTTLSIGLNEDFSGTLTESFLISPEEIEKFELNDFFDALNPDENGKVESEDDKVGLSLTEETIDGVVYKKLTEEVFFENPEQFEQIFETMSLNYNENYFCLSTVTVPMDDEEKEGAEELLTEMLSSDESLAKYSDELQNMKAVISVTVPFEIIDSNGTVSEDKKTVTWDETSKETRFYAIFNDRTSKKAPVISGAKNNHYYNTAILLDIDSEVLLKSVDVNGKPALSGKVDVIGDGAYTVTATDASDNTSVLYFTIDTKKPTVSGVKSGKTYKKAVKINFKDALSGIKKATLNDKKIKDGKEISEKGSYTLIVTDKAGNVKTVKFKVK